MFYFNKIITSFFVFLLLILVGTSSVFAATGTISSSSKYSQFLDLDYDNNGTEDFINWLPSQATNTVSITDSTLTGEIWGETVGWINLGPFNVDAGPTAGVKNTCAGELSGYAWGENTGWINFDPTQATGSNNPSINTTTGVITGTVWSQNHGWIQLSSPDGTYVGLTGTWLGCDSGGDDDDDDQTGYTDLCLNIPNVQLVIPSGYYRTGTDCYPINSSTDVCPNLAGDQTSIPSGYYWDASSSTCKLIVPPTNDDVCPNLAGDQTFVPAGMIVDSQGKCIEKIIPPPTDVCLNMGGDQSSIPQGYILDQAGNCVLENTPVDYCPNLPGNQASPTECPDKIIDTYPQKDPGQGGDGNNQGLLGSINKGLLLAILSGISALGILSSIPGLITRFGNLLLTFFFVLKKRRGIVYDSETKEPLDPAYVSVIDVITGQEVASQITDIEGRFGFVLKKGSYKIIVSKTHYQFPSVKLAGRTNDEVYDHLYFGEVFTVENEEEVVTINIPMDPLGTDWNQQEKRRMSPLKYLLKNQAVWGWLLEIIFIIGFIVSLVITYYYPVWWNIVMTALYVVIAILQATGFGPVSIGKISKQGTPLAHAIVRVYNTKLNREVAHKVTTDLGGYYLLVSKADYYITVEEKKPDATYEKIFTSDTLRAHHGLINKSFDI